MIIHSDSVLAQVTEKARRYAHDRSKHLLCPDCRVRTKLYTLKDRRRKCGVCGKKFYALKKTDETRLKQYADILLCFALDFSAQQASLLTGYRYRLVSAVYHQLRTLLARQSLGPEKIALLMTTEACNRGTHDSVFCKRCASRFRCMGRKAGSVPVFGLRFLTNGQVFIDPLQDTDERFRFDRLSPDEKENIGERFSGYAGFICRGKFHRFAGGTQRHDGAEQLWAWMHERLERHHGISKQYTGLYLKELEWKYNNRLLTPETQALKIAELMPENFLSAWPRVMSPSANRSK